jgi:hypothetical protein
VNGFEGMMIREYKYMMNCKRCIENDCHAAAYLIKKTLQKDQQVIIATAPGEPNH